MRNKKYTDEFLISELYRFYENTGRVPTSRDFINQKEYPCYNIYKITFKSWKNALTIAGFHVYGSLYTEEELINELWTFYNKTHRTPRLSDFIKNDEYISCAHFIKVFNTWDNTLKSAGFKVNRHILNLPENQTCEICGGTSLNGWKIKDNKPICHRCYRRDRNYLHGILNKSRKVE